MKRTKIGPNILIVFQLTVVGVRSKEFEESLDATYKLYRKYQTIIHDDPPNNVREYLDFLQISPIKVKNLCDLQ